MVAIMGLALLTGVSLAIVLFGLLMLLLTVFQDIFIRMIASVIALGIGLWLFTPIFRNYGMPILKPGKKEWYVVIGIAILAFFVALPGTLPYAIVGNTLVDFPSTFLPINTVGELMISWGIGLFIITQIYKKYIK